MRTAQRHAAGCSPGALLGVADVQIYTFLACCALATVMEGANLDEFVWAFVVLACLSLGESFSLVGFSSLRAKPGALGGFWWLPQDLNSFCSSGAMPMRPLTQRVPQHLLA